jgi:hypothetical protein
MKTFFTLSLHLLISSFLWAQAPQGIPYQAVMRNTDGSVMASSAVDLTFMIHDESATGTVVYQESHSLTSNTQGLVSCVVGNGVVSQGNFVSINWGSGAKFLHVLMGATDLGTQQMLSVPYALHSASAANGFSNVSQTGDTLYMSNGTFIIVPGISAANYSTLVLGCTNALACNYNAAATQDNGSCLIQGASCDDGNANSTNDVIGLNCLCSGTDIGSGFLIGQDYMGGRIAYILQVGDAGYIAGETHGLIAAPQDLPGNYQWRCSIGEIIGADGIAIGTGAQNTLDIVASGCGPAAEACASLILNGYDDWFLPSRQELQKLYNNRVAIGGFNLADGYYWSSTEYNNLFAWLFIFDVANVNVNYSQSKTESYLVRPIRVF